MKDEFKDHAASDGKQSSKTENEKRKRINRIKTAIIIIIIILLIIPTLLCIKLGIQVKRLQQNVDDLLEIHGKFEQSLQSAKEKERYAYAAERPNTDVEPLHTDVNKNENLDSTKEENTDNKYDGDGKKDFDTDKINEQNTGTSVDPGLDITEDQDPDTIKQSKGIYKGKKVYLTFDDGPSIYTNDILDILANYNVKATFFVIGKTDEESKKIYQRIVEEGHTLGMHSYSHDYNKIYNSLEDFDKDFTKLWNLLYDIIGYRPKIYRFPGGSANQVNDNGMEDFIRYLNQKSVIYYDWNVVNKDATGVDYTKEQLVDNVLETMTGKTNCVVLLHDASTKKSTVDSLPVLIETLISGDAQLLPLDETVSPIQQIRADSIE
ncbi:MAG: polysaccharide deacetylase [Clostridiales bacterium]|nr:polysaccharide deacetylase [Clostridiales bacterium]